MATVSGGDGLEKTLAALSKKLASGALLRVGFFEDKRYPDGQSVAMIAALNNYGSGSTPPRPFFTNMVMDKSGGWGDQIAALLERTDNDAVKALSFMGEVISDQLRQSIIETMAPPNSPVTDLLKQRFPMGGQTFADVLQARADVANGVSAPAGKPLVHSGVMLDSISWDISE